MKNIILILAAIVIFSTSGCMQKGCNTGKTCSGKETNVPSCKSKKSMKETKEHTCDKCGKSSCDTSCETNAEKKSLADIGPSCTIKNLKSKEEAEKWLKENFYPKLHSINELETGYELVFANPSAEFFETIQYVFNEETKCCPSFSLALVVEPHKKFVRYQYYGSKAIKQEMKDAFIYLGLIKN